MSFFTTGLKELERSYRALGNATAKAEARAVRRVGTTIATNQSRAIATVVNLKVSTIRGAIQIKAQPTPDKPQVVFEVRQKGIPLKDYGASQIRSGVSVRVLKGGSRALLRAAFALRKAGSNIFGRAGVGSKNYGSPHVGRGPIVKLWGPSVLSQYEKPEIQQVGDDTWAQRLPIELDRETNFALKQAGF